MERFTRTTLTGIVTAALLAGSMGVAAAVIEPKPAANAKKTSISAAADGKHQRHALTARSTAAGIQAWRQFRVYGSAKELRPGTRVALQQKRGKRWVTLPASMNTTRKATYKMRVYLGLKGRNTLRIIGGGLVSKPFTVTVH